MADYASEYRQTAEALGWKVTEDGGVLQFERYSPLGDLLTVTAPKDKVAGALEDFAYGWDPEAHAADLYAQNGNGMSSGLRALLLDADAQAAALDELVAATKKAEEEAAERLEEEAEAEAQGACPTPGGLAQHPTGQGEKPRRRGRPKGSKGRTNSRNKGKAGELELAKALRDLGFSGARRGQQYSGTETSADVVGLPYVHPEAKRTECLRLWDALEQAATDTGSSGDMPAVFHRRNRHPWVCIMRLEDWARIYAAYLRERETGGEE